MIISNISKRKNNKASLTDDVFSLFLSSRVRVRVMFVLCYTFCCLETAVKIGLVCLFATTTNKKRKNLEF